MSNYAEDLSALEAIDDAVVAIAKGSMSRVDDGAQSALRRLAEVLGLSNLVCFCFGPDSRLGRDMRLEFATIPVGERLTIEKDVLQKINLLLDRELRVAIPVDWSGILLRDESEKRAVEILRKVLGFQLVSVPVFGNDSALSSVMFASNLANENWRAFKRKSMRTLQVIAHILVRSMVHRESKRVGMVLSASEYECLMLASEKWNSREIARIHKRSIAEVNVKLESGRYKLNCLSVDDPKRIAEALRKRHNLI